MRERGAGAHSGRVKRAIACRDGVGREQRGAREGVSVLTVYAVFADADEAARIAETVVSEELAACANILGSCHSIYRWEGKFERADEVPALFKTTAAKADALIMRIAELHSYGVPAIVAWPIERLSASYGEWVEESVR